MLEQIAALLTEIPPGDTRRDLEIRLEILGWDQFERNSDPSHILRKRILALFHDARKATE